tara:strand:- start:4878 stop:5456 length:579 start_codon:yes stop_codon:yes gene_type:complete
MIKRIFDICFSGFFILLLSLPLLTISLIIFFDTLQNPIFKQIRNGVNGKRFKMYKFKTMKVSEDGISNFTQAKNNDLRITSSGRFLRKFSLDELPQLINIFIGHMSVVGPRPHPIALDEEFKNKIDNYMERYSVKPGLTGLAQINGLRGETDTLEKMQDRINKDLEYANSQLSILVDIRIIILTLAVFFKGN